MYLGIVSTVVASLAIAAKWAKESCQAGRGTSWLKTKNPEDSQMDGQEKLWASAQRRLAQRPQLRTRPIQQREAAGNASAPGN